MHALAHAPLEAVVSQHVADAAAVWIMRERLLRAPHVRVRQMLRLDERLAAHLDGVRVAGDSGRALANTSLEGGGVGEMFVAVVGSLAASQPADLERELALAEHLPAIRPGVTSAFGWTSSSALTGTVSALLNHPQPFRRWVALAACGMHRVEPNLVAARRLDDPDPHVRARAWRTAGELGKHHLVSSASASMADEDPGCRFWAGWSAVLLGDRRSALSRMSDLAAAPGPCRRRAFQLALQAMSLPAAHVWLRGLAGAAQDERWLIHGAGLAGDPAYLPWLISRCADTKVARLAGQSFSFIAGTDLAALELDTRQPENFESGPNDDPNDPNVEMDEDDGLPWPDPVKLQAWWHANSNRFQPGMRYFMGQPLNRDHCLRVLKEGFQRQRIAAALYLSLLNPGTPLFEWRAPARRQQRLLAQMT